MRFNCRVLSIKEKDELFEEIKNQVNSTDIGAKKVSEKGVHLNILVRNLKNIAANILKQEMLSLGADCVVAKEILDLSIPKCNVILTGNLKHYRLLSVKLKLQPFGLKILGKELLKIAENFFKNEFVLTSKDRKIELKKDKTYIMGILNITPDSFSDGGKFLNKDSALKRVDEMLEEGADFIDIGGESTRPGSERVSLDEELKRVIPIINEISKKFPDIPISIDTYKSKVAYEAINHGAWIVNDISGLKFDSEMKNVIIKEKVPAIIMHIKGTPENMQKNPVYENLLNEICEYLKGSIDLIEKNGGNPENLVIDPGIGFGKTFDHNLEILNRLEEFKSFGLPILIGASRKSFLGAILNKNNPEERVLGSLSVAVISSIKGAKILRVHDIKETVEVLKVADCIRNQHV